MKWGVRRYTNYDGSLTDAGKKRALKQEYKKDVEIRKNLERAAHETSKWSKVYDYEAKKDTNRLLKKIDAETKKNNGITDKTAARIVTNKRLLSDRSAMHENNAINIKKLELHVNMMIEKYGDRKIKDVKTKTRNGEKYFNKTIRDDGANYTLRKKKYITETGKVVELYTPIKEIFYYY